MTRIGQILFGILLVLLFFQVMIGFPMPLEQKTETPQLMTPEMEPKNDREQVMGDVHLVESREGNRDWELFAKQAVGSEGEGQWQLENVKVQFYSGKQIQYVVTGEHGKINSETKDMEIAGHVVTRSSNGYVFETSVVQYIAQERLLQSHAPVFVKGPQTQKDSALTVRGNSMEANVDTNEIFIRDHVVATKVLANHKSFSVHSGQLKLSGNNASAKFSDQVRIEVDTLRIDGPEAQFEYRSDTDFLKSVMIMGGAKVSDIDKYATAEQVRFDPEANQLVLSGKPRVVQNQDEIVGDQITFINGGKKVRVEKMKARVEEKK